MSVGRCSGCFGCCLGGYEKLDLKGSSESLSSVSSNGSTNSNETDYKPKQSCWKTFCNFFKKYRDPSEIFTPEQVKKIDEAANKAGNAAVKFLDVWYDESRSCTHKVKVRCTSDKKKYKLICTECKYNVKIVDGKPSRETSCFPLGCCCLGGNNDDYDPEKIRKTAEQVGNMALGVLGAWDDEHRECRHVPQVYKSRCTPDFRIDCPKCQYSVTIEDDFKHTKQNQRSVETSL